MRTRVVTPFPVPARRAAGALAAAIALSVAGVAVAWAQTAPVAPSPPGPATAAPASPAPATESLACRRAKSKVVRAQRSVDQAQRAIDRARAGSATCTTKPVCDRYATKLEELERRRAHRASRLARDKTVAEAACKGS